MTYDSTQDFINDLDKLPGLPGDQRDEWVHTVRSRWIDGVFFKGLRPDPMTGVTLQRMANNQDGFEHVMLDYQVTVHFGSGWSDVHTLDMDPQAAINLGYHLIAAATTAMRDLGKHSWFLGAQDRAPESDLQDGDTAPQILDATVGGDSDDDQ